MAYIYEIIDINNDKRYIGSTINFEDRKYNHLYKLKNNVHDNKNLQEEWNENNYTDSDLTFSILEEVCDNERFERETYWINNRKESNLTLYNIIMQGGNSYGYKHSDESLEEMSNFQKGRFSGRKLTDEWKKNISEATKGDKSHWYGKRGEETNRYGINHTEETKKKISDKLKGRKHTQDLKRKISENSRGKGTNLTIDDVILIKVLKRDSDLIHKEIAELFNTTKYSIDSISCGKSWNYVNIDDIEVKTDEEINEIINKYRINKKD